MAAWHPQDGTHGSLAGAPDAFCFKCSQYCGGTDVEGNALVCAHCGQLQAALASSALLYPENIPPGPDAAPAVVAAEPPPAEVPAEPFGYQPQP